MNMTQALLGEFDHEAMNTRKMLERIPDARLGWRPHAKSMTLARLSGHIAEIPGWANVIFGAEEFDMASVESHKPAEPASSKELLELFDRNLVVFRDQATVAGDAKLFTPWHLKQGGKVLSTMPRIAAARGFVLNHALHHRGQLSVYLRLIDVPVPATYGPSADEQGGF